MRPKKRGSPQKKAPTTGRGKASKGVPASTSSNGAVPGQEKKNMSDTATQEQDDPVTKEQEGGETEEGDPGTKEQEGGEVEAIVPVDQEEGDDDLDEHEE